VLQLWAHTGRQTDRQTERTAHEIKLGSSWSQQLTVELRCTAVQCSPLVWWFAKHGFESLWVCLMGVLSGRLLCYLRDSMVALLGSTATVKIMKTTTPAKMPPVRSKATPSALLSSPSLLCAPKVTCRPSAHQPLQGRSRHQPGISCCLMVPSSRSETSTAQAAVQSYVPTSAALGWNAASADADSLEAIPWAVELWLHPVWRRVF